MTNAGKQSKGAIDNATLDDALLKTLVPQTDVCIDRPLGHGAFGRVYEAFELRPRDPASSSSNPFGRFSGILARSLGVDRHSHSHSNSQEGVVNSNFPSYANYHQQQQQQQVGAKRLAVKVLTMKNRPEVLLKLFHREVDIHRRASGHENILKLHKAVEQDGLIFLVMDLCVGGDVFAALQTKSLFQNFAATKSVFHQVLVGIQHLHRNGLYHRDIKLENIMITSKSNEPIKVVVGDFGLASMNPYTSSQDGSTQYMSPELLGRYGPNFSVTSCVMNDVWALGILLFALVRRQSPWLEASEDNEHFHTYILDPNVFFMRRHCMLPPLNALMCRMLELDPRRRIGIDSLLHNFDQLDRFVGNRHELYAYARMPDPNLSAHVRNNFELFKGSKGKYRRGAACLDADEEEGGAAEDVVVEEPVVSAKPPRAAPRPPAQAVVRPVVSASAEVTPRRRHTADLGPMVDAPPAPAMVAFPQQQQPKRGTLQQHHHMYQQQHHNIHSSTAPYHHQSPARPPRLRPISPAHLDQHQMGRGAGVGGPPAYHPPTPYPHRRTPPAATQQPQSPPPSAPHPEYESPTPESFIHFDTESEGGSESELESECDEESQEGSNAAHEEAIMEVTQAAAASAGFVMQRAPVDAYEHASLATLSSSRSSIAQDATPMPAAPTPVPAARLRKAPPMVFVERNAMDESSEEEDSSSVHMCSSGQVTPFSIGSAASAQAVPSSAYTSSGEDDYSMDGHDRRGSVETVESDVLLTPPTMSLADLIEPAVVGIDATPTQQLVNGLVGKTHVVPLNKRIPRKPVPKLTASERIDVLRAGLTSHD